MKEMAQEYLGPDYDLLRRNCCTFARDACLRLGISPEEIPTWFMNLAGAGAATQDVFQPITSMLSATEEEDAASIVHVSSAKDVALYEETGGFEVIAKRKEGSLQTEMEIVKVVEALEMERPRCSVAGKRGRASVRRTMSWTY